MYNLSKYFLNPTYFICIYANKFLFVKIPGLFHQMKFELTQHAIIVLKERGIPIEWMERVLNQPEKIVPDQNDPELQHALGIIPEYGNRVLRVVFSKKTEPIRIITVYFDRKMRGRI